MTHPPKRGNYWLGTKPMVHHGFLMSWQAGELNLKVINYIMEAVEQCKQHHKSEQPTTVFVTGMHEVCSVIMPTTHLMEWY